MMRRSYGWGAGLLAVMLATSGCYGPFYLTRKVWKWNGEVSANKWVVEAAFLVLTWVPIYGIAGFLDAIVFNSIEFWTGNNPVATADSGTPSTQSKRIVRGNSEARLTRVSDADGERLVIEQFKNGQPAGTLSLRHQQGATVGTDADGHVLFVARTMPDGSILITDAEGKQVTSYSAEKIQRLAALSAR